MITRFRHATKTLIKHPRKIIKAAKLLYKGDINQFLIKLKANIKIVVFVPNFQRRYELWQKNNYLQENNLSGQQTINEFKHKPKISIIIPVYNTPINLLHDCVKSILKQTYSNWELCLVDDGSSQRIIEDSLRGYQLKDNRIKISILPKNKGISFASNTAISMSTGEYIALLDHDDEITDNALYEIVLAINENPQVDMIYSDEDRKNLNGKLIMPFFKPDWSPHLLLSFMYTGHLTVYRKKVIEEVGRFRSGYDFSQDYDLALRVVEITDKIVHIPKILYHWKTVPGSAARENGKIFARAISIKAVKDSLKRRGYKASVIKLPFTNRVVYSSQTKPLISIIVPSDDYRLIVSCVSAYIKKTSYSNKEIIVVTNTRNIQKLNNHLKLKNKIRLITYDRPFNFSDKCNLGAKYAKGRYLVFVNDDTKPLGKEWLDALFDQAQRPDVGVVGGKLIYQDNTIQHAGLVTGVRGLVGTAFHRFPRRSYDYFNFVQNIRNVSAISCACALIPKDIFWEVNGFDVVNTPIYHSDVDLCFKVREKGYLLVYTPFAELKHYGHLSLEKQELDLDQNKLKGDPANIYLLKRWAKYISYDPYFPENMQFMLNHDGVKKISIYAGNNNNKGNKYRGNILLISHDLSLSGAPLALFNIAKTLKKDNYFITIMSSYNGNLLKMCQKESIPVIIDEMFIDGPNDEMKKIIASFDLIFINTIVMWKWVLIGNELDVRTYIYIHESDFGVSLASRNVGIQLALKSASQVLFPCKTTAERYRDFMESYKILPYGIENKIRNNKKITDKNRIRIVHIGSFEPRKGQDVLLNALENLPNKLLSKLDVFFIGRIMDPNYFLDVKKKSVAISNSIHIIEEVDHNKIYDYYDMADIFVCSSRDEVLPLTILEAMAHKKVIISASVGGVGEVIKEGINGFIVPAEDVTSFAKKIIKVCKLSSQSLEIIAQNASLTFSKNFSMQQLDKNVKDIICLTYDDK